MNFGHVTFVRTCEDTFMGTNVSKRIEIMVPVMWEGTRGPAVSTTVVALP